MFVRVLSILSIIINVEAFQLHRAAREWKAWKLQLEMIYSNIAYPFFNCATIKGEVGRHKAEDRQPEK